MILTLILSILFTLKEKIQKNFNSLKIIKKLLKLKTTHSFDVVVPSSCFLINKNSINFTNTADLWVKLNLK